MSSLSEQLQKIIEESIDPLGKISESKWSHKKSETSWSKKQILGHMIDSCYNNHGRFLRAEANNSLIFDAYDQDKWVELNNYEERDADEIIDTFILAHLHLVNLIENISESVLNRKTAEHNFHERSMRKVNKGDELSLSFMIEDYIFHLKHHMKQVLHS